MSMRHVRRNLFYRIQLSATIVNYGATKLNLTRYSFYSSESERGFHIPTQIQNLKAIKRIRLSQRTSPFKLKGN